MNASSIGSQIDKNEINMLKKSNVPKSIYLREESDLVKQLCSIGTKTYGSSHRVPYGDAAKVKTLTEKEYLELWRRIRNENLDKQASCNIKPMDSLN